MHTNCDIIFISHLSDVLYDLGLEWIFLVILPALLQCSIILGHNVYYYSVVICRNQNKMYVPMITVNRLDRSQFTQHD
jgi:hypothetical protein